jgi:hypothetical protein
MQVLCTVQAVFYGNTNLEVLSKTLFSYNVYQVHKFVSASSFIPVYVISVTSDSITDSIRKISNPVFFVIQGVFIKILFLLTYL